ncbi:MAG: porin [bacterium]|nr:porin [bacterium]MDE0240105.1 porin [bacterium]MDE0415843.1 porin [bacterium]
MAADEMMAEPISIAIGGNSFWGIAVVDNDAAAETDDIAISSDVELNFKGSTVLDSGLEIGVRFELEGEEASQGEEDGEANGDQMDETYAYVEGSFGTLRIGNDDAASYSMATTAPYASFIYGINTPYWSGSISSGGWHWTLPGAWWGDSASIMYFSPSINGFQFGVSYAPEAGREVRGGHGTGDMSESNDLISIGARYDGAVGDAGVALSVGHASNDTPGGATITETGAGLQVSMAGVAIGGAYLTTDTDDGSDKLEQMDMGISYSVDDSLSVSANFGTRRKDNAVDTDLARLLANYNLGPGVNVVGALGADSNINDEDTTFAGIALAVSF